MTFKNAMALMFAIVLVAGCQQKKNKKQSLREGRGQRGSTEMNTGPGSKQQSSMQCGSYYVQGKAWGEVTGHQGEQYFYQQVRTLTNPVLMSLPPEDQLGMVSGQSGQPTGVRFWGHAQILNGGGQGQIDPNSAEIRVEIFDDRACQVKPDGSVRPVIPIHIGASQPDFVSTSGYVQGANARITFQDIYGAIILDGQISSGVYSGYMSYTTYETGAQPRILGHFRVPVNGFFSF